MGKETLTVSLRKRTEGGWFVSISRENGREMKSVYCETRWGAKLFAKRWCRKWAKGKAKAETYSITVNRQW
jgi:hypothetical protein